LIIQDFGLHSAVENLRLNRSSVDEDITVVADFLHRNETNLLQLKKAGLPNEVIEACFLLSYCKGSLIPERIEILRSNPIARSGKIRELRSLMEQDDPGEALVGRRRLFRESVARALDILENGIQFSQLEAGKCRHPGYPDEMCDDPYQDLE